MNTAQPRSNASGPGKPAPRSGVPLPGQHLPEAIEPADPDRIRADIRELLAELDMPREQDTAKTSECGNDAEGTDLSRRAHILGQAHDVLVQALATVDKI